MYIISIIISLFGQALTDSKGVINVETAQHSSLISRMEETVPSHHHLEGFCNTTRATDKTS